MDVNICTFVGRLAEDPTYHSASGATPARTTARLIVNRPPAKGANGKAKYDTIQLVAWGVHAETMANYTARGKEVAITGEYRTNYVPDAKTGGKNYTEIMVTHISLGRDSTATKVMKAQEDNGEAAPAITASDLQTLLKDPEFLARVAANKARSSAKPEEPEIVVQAVPSKAEDPFA